MENIQNELEFYTKFTRPLIFALPDAKDRVLAASWVKKIREDKKASDKLKTDYIKLLLFALQRKKLVGVFTDDPTNYEALEEFPDEYDLNTMAQELIEKEMKERRSRIRRQLQGLIGDFPPYITDVSSDLREYVAAQDIPGFGVHCYYAISKDPVTQWQKAHKGIFPKPAKSAVNTSSPIPPGHRGATSESCIVCPGPEGSGPCTPGINPSVESDKKKKRKFKRKLGDSPPVKPLVSGPLPQEEERKPPTWSSTLMKVIERSRPTAATGAIPKIRSEKQIRKAQKKQREYGDCDSDFDEDYNDMERALKDFQRGEIIEQRKKRQKRSRADEEESSSSLDEEEKEDKIEYEFENFIDLNETEYEQELKEDSVLIKYFKDTITKRQIQKTVDDVSDNFRGALPASLGIPLTTPKPSVSPRRLKLSTPVYTFDEPLPKESTKQTDTDSPKPKCSYSCSGRDPEMDKLFQEAAALAAIIDDEPEPDFSETYYVDEEEQEQEPQQELPPEPQPPPREPMQPITRGSPAAHKIFAEVIPPLIQQLQPQTEPPYPAEMSDEDADVNDIQQPLDGGRICNNSQQPEQYSFQQQAIFQTPPRFPMPPLPQSNQEYQYIDYLFGRDRETAGMLKRISNMVSDIEQEQPDPFTLPPTPPLYDVGPMAALMDETFDDLVPASPRSPQICSDQVPQPCRGPCAQSANLTQQSQLPKPQSQSMMKPSGIPAPSYIAKPGTSKLSNKTDIQQPSSSSKVIQSSSKISIRSKGISQFDKGRGNISAGTDRGTGIPQPSAGRGISQPSAGRGIPQPSAGRGIPQPSVGQEIPHPSAGRGIPQPSVGRGIPQPSVGRGIPQPSAGRRIPQPSAGRGIPQLDPNRSRSAAEARSTTAIRQPSASQVSSIVGDRGTGIPQVIDRSGRVIPSAPSGGAGRGSGIPQPRGGRERTIVGRGKSPASGQPVRVGRETEERQPRDSMEISQQLGGRPTERYLPYGQQERGFISQRPPPQLVLCPSTPPDTLGQHSQPLYFPPSQMDVQRQWPEMSSNLPLDLQLYQIDQSFHDPSRSAGKTMTVKRKCPLSMAKREPIAEVQDERYMSPPSPPYYAPPPFPHDDTMLDFAKGYVPPVYQSPPGISRELPPQLVSPVRREPTSLREYFEDQRLQTQKIIANLSQSLNIHQIEPPKRRICSSSSGPRRRLNFDDLSTPTDTDTFLSGVMARNPDLPPLPPDYIPDQRTVTSPRPGGIPGWESPERRLPSSPLYRSPVPADMLDEVGTPPLCYSPPQIPESPPFVAPEGDTLFDTSMGPQYSSPPGTLIDQTFWHTPLPSPDMSSGMNQMLNRLPQAQSYLRCKGKRGILRDTQERSQGVDPRTQRRQVRPPIMSPIPGSPAIDERFGVPPNAQHYQTPPQARPASNYGAPGSQGATAAQRRPPSQTFRRDSQSGQGALQSPQAVQFIPGAGAGRHPQIAKPLQSDRAATSKQISRIPNIQRAQTSSAQVPQSIRTIQNTQGARQPVSSQAGRTQNIQGGRAYSTGQRSRTGLGAQGSRTGLGGQGSRTHLGAQHSQTFMGSQDRVIRNVSKTRIATRCPRS